MKTQQELSDLRSKALDASWHYYDAIDGIQRVWGIIMRKYPEIAAEMACVTDSWQYTLEDYLWDADRYRADEAEKVEALYDGVIDVVRAAEGMTELSGDLRKMADSLDKMLAALHE